MQALTAWLYWNPDRFAFKLPFLELPIAWYGVLFAGGFMVSYFIMTWLLSKQLVDTREIAEGHISDWPRLLHRLQTAVKGAESPALQKITGFLKVSEKLELERYQKETQPSKVLKEAVLRAMRKAVLEDSKLDPDHFYQVSSNRLVLEKLFPRSLYPISSIASGLADKLCWVVVLGTVVGARLGHVFFYNWDYFSSHPIEILSIRDGGLASHGGTIGIILCLFLYLRMVKSEFPTLTMLSLIDMLVIPSAFVAFCIRFGNFINQEIIGTISEVPWAVVFGNAADGSLPAPRHPVQLYEGLFYLGLFFALVFLWKKKSKVLPQGTATGIFFLAVFLWRFLMEYFKASLGGAFAHLGLETGQVLSLPFVFGALILLVFIYWKQKLAEHSVVR